MSRTWTKEQLAAIEVRSGDYLVSASAGSGKTAVLTERTFRIISEGASLDELLILTFTDKAANEMKNRIRAELIKAGMHDIASNLDASNIQTFDAFALSIVKKYHYLLGIKASVQIIDETLIKIKQRKIIDEIFDHYYEDDNDDFKSLIYYFSIKNDTNIKDFILDVDRVFDLKLNKEKYINEYVATFFNKERLNKDIEKYVTGVKQYFADAISMAKTLDNVTFADVLIELLSKFSDLKTIEEFNHLFFEEHFPESRKKDMKLEEEDSAKIKKISATYKNYANIFKDLISNNNVIDNYLNSEKYVRIIIDIVKELNSRLKSFKDEVGSYTFSDIAKFALKVLDIDEACDEIKKKLRFIMVDEYQDTSDLQERVISKLSNNNVFAVGDVKQSIYRFRNANPDNFMQKHKELEKMQKGLLSLSKNFRSREEVIESNNRLFSNLMKSPSCEYNYSQGHKMIPGSDSYITHKFLGQDANHEFYVFESKVGNTKAFSEASIICQDIVSKVKEGYKILEGDTFRPCKYSDFAILIHSKTDFRTYQTVFSPYSIPLKSEYDESIRENDVSYTFRNVIKVILDVRNDERGKDFKHAFIGVLRSFIGNYNDREISEVMKEKRYENDLLYKKFVTLSNSYSRLSLSETVSHIFVDFNFYDKLVTIGNVESNLALLNHMHTIAKQMETIGFTLADFVQYFSDLDEFDIPSTMQSNESVEDSVKLMSIHASKGLEFKVVYLAGTTSRFVNSRSSKLYSCDSQYGINIIADGKDVSLYSVLAKEKEKLESLRERIRVLYVALTRPEEKCIITLTREEYNKIGNYLSFDSIGKYSDFFVYSGCSFKATTKEILDVDAFNLNDNSSAKKNMKDDVSETIKIVENDIPESKVISYHRASKENDEANTLLLELGNMYHYYLELVDFKTKDTSFIKDIEARKRIDEFLSNKVFAESSKAKILHEYAFHDEKNGIDGVIDLMLVYNDHIDLIDFKLSNIDDEAYDRQISIYYDYIKTISKVDIHTYVMSIMKNVMREVKHE